MVSLTQEHLEFVIGIMSIIVFVKGISLGIDKKIEKNNQYLENLIDKKLDKIIYNEHKDNFEKWNNEKNEILKENIEKIENTFKSDLQEIKEELKRINTLISNCKKNG
ncbi:hypothetical protein [Fusobacterium nucleatum]|uniref:hypothetical protein n=1 Tax=Fusobacterium nucleatum TaxID=851 RepID=UPI0023615DF2|nr:hypothetical protein [Fusobacterium nucleatum]WDD89070.1 hypothetical protein PSR68_00160 [Fusobacterium nucleatum]